MPSTPDRAPAKLALADGLVVAGRSVGAAGESGGELCFNTSMAGYQEIMTDPSYVGQVMMMTYPHIGNYGASDEDLEADRPMVAGLVTRAFVDEYSNATPPRASRPGCDATGSWASPGWTPGGSSGASARAASRTP
jgi:carbamoyl-phosphate synthase small subunit